MIHLYRSLILFCAFSSVALTAAETSAIGTGAVDSTAFVKVFIGLMVTIGIIFLLAWLSRKTKLINNLSSGYQIKTLATQPLSHREKLCLVEVGGKHILLGLAPGSINTVHVFDEPVEQESATDQTSNSPFAEQFKKALGIQKSSTEKDQSPQDRMG